MAAVPGTVITMAGGRTGAYEINVEGVGLIHSKLESAQYPVNEEVVAKVKAIAAGTSGAAAPAAAAAAPAPAPATERKA